VHDHDTGDLARMRELCDPAPSGPEARRDLGRITLALEACDGA
jgi:hypothetical protein